MTQPQPGDFFVTRTGGWIAEQIRWFTSSPVNHAGIFVGPVVGLTGDQVIEARPGGAGYAPAANYTNATWSTHALPDKDVPTPAQRVAIVWAARQMLGTPYGFLDILAIALAQARLGNRVKVAVALASQPWWVKRICSMRTEICSQLVSACYTAAGINLFTDGRLVQLVSPGDLLALLTPAPEVTPA